MRSIAILTLLVPLGAWGVVRNLPTDDVAAATLVTPAGHEVHSIAIDGNGLPLAQLREVLATRVGSEIDTAQLERDRAALATWLAERGYLAATVGSPIVTFMPSGGAGIVFEVVRGPLFHLRNVTLAGPHWDRAGVVTLAAGDEVRGDRLERARRNAEDTLARAGKPVRVELVVQPDLADAMVDVTLVIR